MTNFKKYPTKSQETKKIKKILHEEIRLGLNANSDSDSEKVDLKKELFPLSHYINDREEMIEQMFAIIKGDKLSKMLPPILKDIPLDELKADCLIHLLGMSTKRILATLDGREIYSSSDSKTNSDSPTSPNKKAKLELKPFIIKQEGCSDISDNSEEVVLVDPDAECSSKKKDNHNRKKKHRKKKNILPEKTKKTKTYIQEVKRYDDNKIQHHNSSTDSENEVEEIPKEGKTLLEILELEMRARAIRALLHKGGNQENGESSNNLTEPINSTERYSERTTKHQREESENNRVTPTRNFRKKKKKDDDVIVVAPKLVTIDLTEDNQIVNADGGFEAMNEPTNNEEVQDLINSIQINTKAEQDAPNSKTDPTETGEEFSNASEPKSSDDGGSDIDEVIDIPDSPETNKSENIADKKELKQNERPSGKQEQSKSNWAQRWLDSKDVKRVVSTSKICGNIRKKIRNAKLAKKSQQNLPKEVVDTPEIHGSVNEYQSLPKSTATSNMTSNDIENNSKDNVQVTHIELNAESGKSTTILTVPVDEVEQVQDVSSTKNEMSVINNTECQSNDLQQVNDTLTSKSNLLQGVKDGSSQDLESRPKNDICESDNKIDTTNAFNIKSIEKQIENSLLLNTNQEEKILDKSPIKCPENVSVSTSNEKLSSDTNYDLMMVESNSYQTNPSTDKEAGISNQNKHINNENYFEMVDNTEHSLDIVSERCKLQPIPSSDNGSSSNTQKNSHTKSSQKLESTEVLSSTPDLSNEPEMLEINLTEEDRQLD